MPDPGGADTRREGGELPAVAVAPGALELVLAHARREAPLECCGLLLGRGRVIVLAYPARNQLGSATRFEIDPADHCAAQRLARERGLAVIGAYHSHPVSGARPSPRDLEEAAHPDFLHLIASVVDAEVRAYQFAGGNFREARLVGST